MSKIKEYENVLRKIEKRPKDRLGILGEVGILAGGAVGGGAIAATVGSSSIWGLTTVASVIGVTVVAPATLPVILGGGVAGLAVAKGASYFIKSGSKNDLISAQNMQTLKNKIEEEKNKLINSDNACKISGLCGVYAELISLNLVSEGTVEELLQNIKDNKIDYNFAYETALELLNSAKNLK